MLQQTQVHRVLLKYHGFLRTFPTLPSLARARQRDVVLAWQGLGYNNRAVRLHRLAREVVRHHNGRLPADERMLCSLPGIGKYTARALLVSAFRKKTTAVDINVQRVLSRVFWKLRSTTDVQSGHVVWLLADQLVPERRAFDWNQGLMDLGALVCTARRPRCTECPLAVICASRGRLKRDAAVAKRAEPSLDGIPNRIYRGRIVEALRGTSGSMALPALGKSIHKRFSRNHHRWLEHLIRALEKDGLVKHHKNRASHRVSLA